MSLSETVARRPAVIDDLLDHITEARGAVEDVFARARAAVARDVPKVSDAEQHRLHALAWLARWRGRSLPAAPTPLAISA